MNSAQVSASNIAYIFSATDNQLYTMQDCIKKGHVHNVILEERHTFKTICMV